MSNLTVWLIVTLIVSIGVNIFMFWYIRSILNKLLFVSGNLSDLVDLLTGYRNHLKAVYSLETYYGDETIKFLIKHTNSLLDVLEDYSDIYKLTEPIELDEEDEESYDDQEETGPQAVNEENVFYGGTRSRNS